MLHTLSAIAWLVASIIRSADASSSSEGVRSFRVCMNNPQGIGATEVKTAAVPIYDCNDAGTRRTPIGTYYYICGPVPNPTLKATSTQHIIIGKNSLFYSTIFDFSPPSFEHATPLSTTGKFPAPKDIESISYTTERVPNGYEAAITVSYKRRAWNPLRH